MDSFEQTRRLEQARRLEKARRRMRWVSLAAIPLEAAAVVGLYFIVPLSEVVAVAALFLVGGGASVAWDRQMAGIAARAAQPLNPAEVSRPMGPRKARQVLGVVMGLYVAFAVAGGVIGNHVGGGESGAVVGLVSGLIVGYALLFTVLGLYKRVRSGSSTSE